MIRVVHFIFSELDIDNFDILIYGTMIAIGIKTNINKLLRIYYKNQKILVFHLQNMIQGLVLLF